MRGATRVTLQLHQILHLPWKWISSLSCLTDETSFTMHGATRCKFQLHLILRLPRKMNLMIDPHHRWTVIYNARSNKRHHPTSPNTAPATQNESNHWSAWHMKRHLQGAEQVKPPPLKLTKYCACHEILTSRFQREIPEGLPPIERTIRGHSEHTIFISHPLLRRPSRSDLGDGFSLKNTTFRAPAISQNVTKCCACHEKSHSNFTKYCACHEKCILLFSTVFFLSIYSLGIYSL